MVRVRLLLALAVLGAVFFPYDQATYAVDDSSHRHGIGAPPIDPIIEEPLRPLLPSSPEELDFDTVGCGAQSEFTLPAALFLTQFVGLAANRRRTTGATSEDRPRRATEGKNDS